MRDGRWREGGERTLLLPLRGRQGPYRSQGVQLTEQSILDVLPVLSCVARKCVLHLKLAATRQIKLTHVTPADSDSVAEPVGVNYSRRDWLLSASPLLTSLWEGNGNALPAFSSVPMQDTN